MTRTNDTHDCDYEYKYEYDYEHDYNYDQGSSGLLRITSFPNRT